MNRWGIKRPALKCVLVKNEYGHRGDVGVARSLGKDERVVCRHLRQMDAWLRLVKRKIEFAKG